MKIKKIEWYEGTEHLAQAINSGVEFSFVSNKYKQISPFCYCKDFLQDALQAFLCKKRNQIYGFTYDPEIHQPISLVKTKLLVANSSDPDFSEKIPNCIDFLARIEKKLGIKPTTAVQCKDPGLKYIKSGIWLFQGSRRWMKSPPMISMYTLLIRLGFGHKIGDTYTKTIDDILNGITTPYQSVDRDRLSQAKPGIDQILQKGDKTIFKGKIRDNYPKTIGLDHMHNKCGIIGFSVGHTATLMPAWHK